MAYLKPEVEVTGDILHQVDRKAIAAGKVIAATGRVEAPLVVTEDARDLVFVTWRDTQAGHSIQTPLLLLEHLGLHDKWRRENGCHSVHASAQHSGTRQSTARPLYTFTLNS